jgi:holo-[acyl-carrier protein] synthase
MDIVGTGVDIEDIDRFTEHSKDINDPFLKKIFSDSELNYCFFSEAVASRLAVRYAAKEAVTKALCSLGLSPIEYRLIEVINDKNGCPRVVVNKKGYEKFTFFIALSHCNDKAIAFVMALQ